MVLAFTPTYTTIGYFAPGSSILRFRTVANTPNSVFVTTIPYVLFFPLVHPKKKKDDIKK